MVPVVDLKDLVKGKDRTCTSHTLRKYIPYFGSVVGINKGT